VFGPFDDALSFEDALVVAGASSSSPSSIVHSCKASKKKN
jgi:hypothetical protein